MKKSAVDCWPDYDEAGRWCLRLRKKKGRFTVDELVDALAAHEWDFYAVILKAIPEDGYQYFEDIPEGDYLTAYRATDFLREGNT